MADEGHSLAVVDAESRSLRFPAGERAPDRDAGRSWRHWNLIATMDQDTLAFPGRPANLAFGDPGQRSGVMEGIARLDARFLVDAFDESIAQLDRFYDLSRKGRMAGYLADFAQVPMRRSRRVFSWTTPR